MSLTVEWVYRQFLGHNIRLLRDLTGHKCVEYGDSMGLLIRLDSRLHLIHSDSVESLLLRFGQFRFRFKAFIRQLVWGIRTFRVQLPRLAHEWKTHPHNTTGRKGWIYER